LTGGIAVNFALILSGGTGSRLKGIDIPKQYYKVCGRMVISYCMETLEQTDAADAYLVVAAEEWREAVLQEIRVGSKGNPSLGAKFRGFAEPGENRQMSILNGLRAFSQMAGEEDLILVLDAARPLTSAGLLERCVAAAERADGAMPALKMKDTVYYSTDGKQIDALLERDKLLAGQAPEAFRYGAYLRANEALTKEELLQINGSSEPAVKAGLSIALVDGEETNFKITTAEDLRRFEKMMEER
jgi:2-C-methyl-D-erythritol 4-phosphate cytidylyltransferase